MKRTIDILTHYQKHLLGVGIFLSLSAVSVTIRQDSVELNLRNYPGLMLLLVIISIALIFAYVSIDKIKIQNLGSQIEVSSVTKKDQSASLIHSLTSRQKEVYDLIKSGKTNKEILSLLFIEQSTLKSHINQIYKKLNVKNRKELTSKY